MFRRPGKNPLDEETSLYQQEEPLTSHYKYGGKKLEHPSQDMPSRIFDTTRQPVATPIASPLKEENWGEDKTTSLPHHFKKTMNEETPETTLGEGVTFRGELSFERLLRIDGVFEGQLLSQGKVIVGPKGVVKANLTLREAIVEGVIEGNVTVQEKLELRGDARVIGDIVAKSICVDEGVTIEGHVSVKPQNASASSTI